MIMNRVGPVMAIGKPGESLPELGAARLYVGDDAWQARITDLIRQARFVVVQAGTTANLRWEIAQCTKLLPLRRLILVSFGQGEDVKIFQNEVERRFGRAEWFDHPQKKSPFWRLVWIPRFLGIGMEEVGRIIYFGNDLRPIVEPILNVLGWRAFVIVAWRPYLNPMESAFRRVFRQLDLPWVDRKNQTTTVMLALFGGLFGSHHFYLGNRMRGLFCLIFCWTGFPLILSLIDAFRIALTDEEQFERRFVHHSPVKNLRKDVKCDGDKVSGKA